ncbi:MAG: aminomethyl-transferring glycine dehydrogenase subunit GcvPB, partial [Gammaproteobacteria bacterium]|nr:aminomethyl-transferring glycine dehydrogenase subunit GcvPB [Gammaproteobacteria bacterium]
MTLSTPATTIFDLSASTRSASAQCPPALDGALSDIPAQYLRDAPAGLPEVSELQVVRHYTNLSVK